MPDPRSPARPEDVLLDVRLRVERKYANEVAEDRQGTPATARARVGKWLAQEFLAEHNQRSRREA